MEPKSATGQETPHDCPVCGGRGEPVASFAPSVTSESKILEARSRLSLCDGCGHLFTALDVDLRRYYATAYDATLTDGGPDELVATSDGQTAFRTDVDYALFRRMVGDRAQPRASVFEYGCGRGRILSRLARDGFSSLRGHDLSEAYRAPVEALVGAANAAIGARPEPRGDVDVACTFFVLEHDEDPVNALRYLRAMLRPDGVLFAMVPSFTTNLGDLACADHAHHFSAESLARALGVAGFEVRGVDDTSAVGSVAVVARPGPVVIAPAPGDPLAVTAARDLVAYLSRLDAVVREVDPGRPIYLYGAGFYAALTLARLRARGLGVSGLFDQNPRKQGTVRHGLHVAAPDAACTREHGDASLLVCVNARLSGQIARRYEATFARVMVA